MVNTDNLIDVETFKAWAEEKGYVTAKGSNVMTATSKDLRLKIELCGHLITFFKTVSLRNSYCTLSFENTKQLDTQLAFVLNTIKKEDDAHS